ncbi:MAG: DUF4340 domain-containing protein [Alphaproteobacteria bacterium]|nr:DUF4340 domain-containing protein [Alphaproteobacteria bacterium]
MSPRFFTALLVATVIAVAGASWSVMHGPVTATVGTGEVAFPPLAAGPDAVHRIELRTTEGTLSFERSETGGWVTPEKHRYPVSSRRIREVVTELADMRLVEPKTRMAERYPLIGVEPVDAADANSVELRLEDAGGRVLAHALFGVRVWHRTGDARHGIFLREPGADRAWLASGGTDMSYDMQDWLDRAIIDVAADEIAAIAVRPEAAEDLVVSRGSDGMLTADGREVDPDVLRRLASGLARLSLIDVAPRREAVAAGASLSYTTGDGLVIEVAERQDGWLTFQATATGPDARQRADALNDRLAPWQYRLADWQYERLFGAALKAVDG